MTATASDSNPVPVFVLGPACDELAAGDVAPVAAAPSPSLFLFFFFFLSFLSSTAAAAEEDDDVSAAVFGAAAVAADEPDAVALVVALAGEGAATGEGGAGVC